MKVLIVDDEPVNSYILETMLKGRGYEAVSAGDGQEALELLRGNPSDMIISDILMPRMDGFQLCRECRKDPALRRIPFVFYTATYTEQKDKEFALSLGADGFLVKPMESKEFLHSIETIIADAKTDAKTTEPEQVEEEDAYLKEYNERLVHKLEKKMLELQEVNQALRAAEKESSEHFQKLQKALQATIRALALTTELRDPCTSGHQRRVASLARAISEEMGIGAEETERVHMAAAIHDIGKISVPAEILSKPTRLTEMEFNLIKIHSQAGYDFLTEIEFPAPVPLVIYQHHERLDGSGYPAGLKGAEICREARVIAVADVVEAVASHRPYRPADTIDAALEEIEGKRATLYDPDAVDACLTLFRKKGFRFD